MTVNRGRRLVETWLTLPATTQSLGLNILRLKDNKILHQNNLKKNHSINVITNVLEHKCTTRKLSPHTGASSQEPSLGTLLSSFDLGFLKILGVYIYFYLMLSSWTFPLV